LNGNKSLFLVVYRQSGSNTVGVADAVKATVAKLNEAYKNEPAKPVLTVVQDNSRPIRLNVSDVEQSIFLGIFLTILVVFLFLANGRSTIITGVALPDALIGSFVLLAVAGFTINVTTLLALSIAVGLLVDDAIVVRENIFRHIEMGKPAAVAASEGTHEVMTAVIGTTLCILAVFGPVAFLNGIVGQFLREFGLTVCFAMIISLFDALTMGPMLSAYYAGIAERKNTRYGRFLTRLDKIQDDISSWYEKFLRRAVKRPFLIIAISLGILS